MAVKANSAGGGGPEARNGLGELGLPVAVDARDPQDLSFEQAERDPLDGRMAPVAGCPQAGDFERGLSCAGGGLWNPKYDFAPYHHAGEGVWRCVGSWDRGYNPAVAEYGDGLADS